MSSVLHPLGARSWVLSTGHSQVGSPLTGPGQNLLFGQASEFWTCPQCECQLSPKPPLRSTL